MASPLYLRLCLHVLLRAPKLLKLVTTIDHQIQEWFNYIYLSSQPCPSDSKPFRKMQCESVNVNYTDYIRSGAGNCHSSYKLKLWDLVI